MATMVSTTPSTPPPHPSRAHTPSAPRLGWDDHYEPYTPRMTTRSQYRARLAQTPPPPSSNTTTRAPNTDADLSTPPPRSPQTASKRQPSRNSQVMGGRRVSGALTNDATAHAAQALGLERGSMQAIRSTTRSVDSMLPTPNKTPVNRPTKHTTAFTSVARNLFPTSTPKKNHRKKYLDGFEGEEEAPIKIFTDSHDRVPEVDIDDSNPFYDDLSIQPDPAKRASPSTRKTTVDDSEVAGNHEEGVFYVFRGRRSFRKFSDVEANEHLSGDASDDEEIDLSADLPAHLAKPLSRSAIKPRLLFPRSVKQQQQQQSVELDDDDEEAVTDIEEGVTATPKHSLQASTPKAPRFAPFTPPTTGRVTRSKDVDLSMATPKCDLPGIATTKRISPFDSWQRTKNGSGTGQSKKREGGPIGRAADGKRQRSTYS